jgi:threonine/homoserine/homoserine lactone efflux protein
MNYQLLVPFSIGMFILAASPGPGVFGSVSKAMSSGFIASLFFIGGLVLGDIIFLIFAILGMSFISQLMGELFFFIKILGGIYLIYLGIKMFLAKEETGELKEEKAINNFKTFTGGFLVTMGNPKPIIFYASVLPTILNINEVRFFEGLFMAILVALISYIVLGTYSLLAALGRKVIQKKNLTGMLNKGAGTVMISTGAYIVVK